MKHKQSLIAENMSSKLDPLIKRDGLIQWGLPDRSELRPEQDLYKIVDETTKKVISKPLEQ